MNRTILGVLVLLLLGWAAPGSAADPQFMVIVNASNPNTVLSRDSVGKIFLKATRSWGNGDAAKPVDLQIGAATREAFSRSVLRESAGAIEERWQRQIFSGRDVPPPRKGSEAEVIEYVARYPGAIGYVAAGTPLPRNVKRAQVQ
jgi:ABC-type phosphate transport system substrate-binding protein